MLKKKIDGLKHVVDLKRVMHLRSMEDEKCFDYWCI